MSEEGGRLDPAVTARSDGEAWWWLGALAEIKLTAEQSGGALSILEITEPPNPEGVPGPLHIHHREHETFRLLEGTATFRIGDVTVEAGPGDVLFGPRGVPHTYTVGPEGCRLLYVMTPGGFENLVRGMSVPADARTLPPPSVEPPDWERIAAVAEANGCELLD